MIDFHALRHELHELLRTLNGGEMNVYAWPDPQPATPCILIPWPERVDYHVSYSKELSTTTMRLEVIVPSADLESATARLDEYVNPSGVRSVKELLESYKATTWSSLVVDAASGWRQIPELDALACQLEITIHA